MKNTNEFTQISFWKALNPNLSISTTPFSTSSNAFKLEDAEIAQYLQYVIEEGYFDTRVVMDESEITDIANAIKSIVQYGLPPIFIFVYDEIWQTFSRLSNLLTPILGQNYKVLLAGMWAWHIDKDSAGFKPHRDLFDLATQADGRPINLTVWLPFTDATPLNGCMYVLPTHLDAHHPDNLRYIQIDDVKNIRAVPAKAGSVLAWDASILHWGAKASCRASQPRISVAMDFMIDSPEAQDNRMLYADGPDSISRAIIPVTA